MRYSINFNNKEIVFDLEFKKIKNINLHINRNGKIIDYQEEQEPILPTKEEIIDKLKEELASADYKIIKASEYQLLGLEVPYDLKELHSIRQKLRDEINKLGA